eukprot:scaffold51558_cov29-Tisochrysis_lutea.AAC.5
MLSRCEPGRFQQRVDGGRASGSLWHVWPVERVGMFEVLARRKRRPERVLARHIGAVRAVHRKVQRLSIEVDVADGVAGSLFEGQHVQEHRFARARGAEDR